MCAKYYEFRLIIFGTHNLQTFKHNTLINELLITNACMHYRTYFISYSSYCIA